jgi:hypothetical protein
MSYTCEFCGKVSEERVYGTGRFCSQSCACKFSARAKKQQKATAEALKGVASETVREKPIQQHQQSNRGCENVIKQGIMQETTTIRVEPNGITIQTDRVKENNNQSLQNKFKEVPHWHIYGKPQRTREQLFKLGARELSERLEQHKILFAPRFWEWEV